MNFTVLADGLRRPEGVCVGADGSIWVSDQGGLLACVAPDGSSVARHGEGGVEPNGLAVDAAGRIVVADYGGGGVLRYDPHSGATERLVDASVGVDGVPVRRANHPAIDADGRIWCTNSTNAADDVDAVLKGCDDGFVFLIEPDGSTRIVADGLAFPNGLAFSPDGRWLYVAASASHSLLRAPVGRDGTLAGPFAQHGPDLGAVPDGVAVADDGTAWVTLVFQRRALVTVSPDGELAMRADGFAGNPTNVALGPDRVYVTSADGNTLWNAIRPIC